MARKVFLEGGLMVRLADGRERTLIDAFDGKVWHVEAGAGFDRSPVEIDSEDDFRAKLSKVTYRSSYDKR